MATTPSQQELDEIKESFVMFDTECKNGLSADQFVRALRSLGHAPTQQQVCDLMTDARDGDIDLVTYTDLATRYATVYRQEQHRETLSEAFNVLDREDRGHVSTSVLSELVTSVGDTLDDVEKEQFLELLTQHTDKRGHLNYQLLINALLDV